MVRFASVTAGVLLTAFAGAATDDSRMPVEDLGPARPAVAYLAPENVPKLPSAPRRYQAPEGFAGHLWGEPRAKFTRLPELPQLMRAAWTRGAQDSPEFVCTGVLGSAATGIGGCSINDIVTAMETRRFHGAGFHVLSEYKIESQGFKFTGSGVTLHPVIYQFCANWNAVKREVPQDFGELNQFCGMRLLFETETLEQLRSLPEDHVTRYDLVLSELISRYGKPARFLLRGKVTVQAMGETNAELPVRDRKFSSWRWCPTMDRAMYTSCKSSIILSLDPDAGRAVVLLATPAMWKYAYASNDMNGYDGLFALMHGRKVKPPAQDQAPPAKGSER